MNIRQIAMLQYTYRQVKQLFLELFCVSRTGVADPNIAHRKRSTFYIVDEGETEEGEHGFWVIDEETGEEGFTGLYTETEFWVLGAKGSYSKRRLYGRSLKKGKPKGYGKKGKRSRPGFRSRSNSKGYAACDHDQQDAAFWGKGQGKKGKKGMKGKDSFKGMPSWKGKGKGDGKNKGGKPFQQQQPPQANVAQQASSSASQAPEKPEIAQAEESWSYDFDTYWTDDWLTYDSYYGYDGDYPQGDWYNWSYFASFEELTFS